MTPAPLLTEYWIFEAAIARLEGGGGAGFHSDIEDLIELASSGLTRIRLWARHYLGDLLQTTITEDEHEAPSETGRVS